MYGHAGRIEDSYQMYLNVLENKPTSYHALKGIAWIAYANDKSPAEAKKILHTLASVKPLPDVHFLLAEIAAYEHDFEEEKQQLGIFYQKASQKKYQGMYSKYLIEIENNLYKNHAQAIALARNEIDKRPTPMAYDLLAWSYYHAGDYTKALDVAQTYIEGKTYEPEIAYHLASIYLAIGNTAKAKEYYQQVLESAYELGPVTVQEMQSIMEG
jgi:tetratricopeptide (TPR) repeat protein